MIPYRSDLVEDGVEFRLFGGFGEGFQLLLVEILGEGFEDAVPGLLNALVRGHQCSDGALDPGDAGGLALIGALLLVGGVGGFG